MPDMTSTSTYTVLTVWLNNHRTWSSTGIIFIISLCHRWTTSRISSVTQYVFSISLWTQITLPMRHTWEPADSSFNGKSIPCSGRASFTKASKGNCWCESIHAGVVLFQAMRNYKKSQTINISVQPYRGIKKIYSHAGQYAKITYKMSLSLSKILSIQGFSSKSASDYTFFFKIDKMPIQWSDNWHSQCI